MIFLQWCSQTPCFLPFKNIGILLVTHSELHSAILTMQYQEDVHNILPASYVVMNMNYSQTYIWKRMMKEKVVEEIDKNRLS